MAEFGRFQRELEHCQEKFVVEALAEELPPEWVDMALARSGRQSKRRRLLTAEFMIWFTVLLGIFHRYSYLNLLDKLHDTWWSRRRWPEDRPPTSSAVSKARDRLGVEPMQSLYEHSASEWIAESQGRLFGGRPVFAIDGTTLKTPDSKANRAHFGAPGASRGKAAYPQMRAVMLVEVGTRLVVNIRYGSYRTGELTLARGLLDDVDRGSLILLDRYFWAYDFMWKLYHDRGADFIVRVKQSKKARHLDTLGPGDAIVEVKVPPKARRENPDLPTYWVLREITYRPVGGRDTIRLFTTLLDPAVASARELAGLYRERWEEETAIDEIKTHQCECATVNRPVLFRSQTPSRVEQELYGLLIAYNITRRLMSVASAPIDVSPLRLSFTSALARIREAIDLMMNLTTLSLASVYATKLQAIARSQVPLRRSRRNRREVKIKMSKYPIKKEKRRSAA